MEIEEFVEMSVEHIKHALSSISSKHLIVEVKHPSHYKIIEACTANDAEPMENAIKEVFVKTFPILNESPLICRRDINPTQSVLFQVVREEDGKNIGAMMIFFWGSNTCNFIIYT